MDRPSIGPAFGCLLVAMVTACDTPASTGEEEVVEHERSWDPAPEPPVAAAPVAEAEEWSSPSIAEDWERIEGEGYVLRIPPGSSRRLPNYVFENGTLSIGTGDPFTPPEAGLVRAALEERPRLQPGEVSAETCLEYLYPPAFFRALPSGHRWSRPPGQLVIASQGERRACVFHERSGGLQTSHILVAAPGANLWIDCTWYNDESVLADACDTIAQSWETPAD